MGAPSLVGYGLDTRAGASVEAGYGEAAASLMVYGVDADGRAGAGYGVGAPSLVGYGLDTRAGAGVEAGYGVGPRASLGYFRGV